MVEIMPLKPREVWAIPIGTEYMIHPAKQLVIPEEWVHVLPYHFPFRSDLKQPPGHALTD